MFSCFVALLFWGALGLLQSRGDAGMSLNRCIEMIKFSCHSFHPTTIPSFVRRLDRQSFIRRIHNNSSSDVVDTLKPFA